MDDLGGLFLAGGATLWLISIAILLLLALVLGYLWNLYVIKELQEMNKMLHKDLNHLMDVIARSNARAPIEYTNRTINPQADSQSKTSSLKEE